jgi:tellurite resistance protein TerC
MQTIGTPALWVGFLAFVLAMLALDLGVFHRESKVIRVRDALGWTAVWIGFAALFAAGLYHWYGAQRALEFTTGYLIEKALSVDNIFVFVVIFGAFRVPAEQQHRVLFWGIFGALIMRAIFIVLGAALLQQFHWIIYVFGGLLIVTAIRLVISRESEVEPQKTLPYRLFKRFIPSTDGMRGNHFLVKEGGKILATPLLAVLLVVEFTDVIFAVDSIPAIFAVTQDPFVVFTSNIFAILGLRSLYFLLAGVVNKFHYLKTGLAAVLAFVGAKMLFSSVFQVPIVISLVVIAGLLILSIVASLLFPPRHELKMES